MNAWSQKVIDRSEVEKAQAALEALATKPPDRVTRAEAIRQLAVPIRRLLTQGYTMEEVIKALASSEALRDPPVAALRQLLRDAEAEDKRRSARSGSAGHPKRTVRKPHAPAQAPRASVVEGVGRVDQVVRDRNQARRPANPIIE